MADPGFPRRVEVGAPTPDFEVRTNYLHCSKSFAEIGLGAQVPSIPPWIRQVKLKLVLNLLFELNPFIIFFLYLTTSKESKDSL